MTKWLCHLCISISLIGLVGCASIGPDYKPPSLDKYETNAFTSIELLSGEKNTQISEQWWTDLKDPNLTSLIETALNNNRDIGQALQRVETSRSLLKGERATLYPSGGFEVAFTRSRPSAAGIITDVPNVGTQLEPFPDRSLSSGNLTISWEIDLFGRLRRSVEVADASLQEQQALARAARLTVASEVATAYASLRGAQLRITVSKSNADIQEKSYKATQQLLNTGSATRLDVSRAKAQLDTTRASIVARQADYDFALFRLAVLVGETPTAFKARFKINDEMPTLPILIPSRMPGEVLRARPDIMVAEKRLARETALIGVALGDLYPRLTLGATAGTSAVDASDLGSEASLGFRYGPNLRWAGLDLARLKSRVSAQESRTQGAIFAFEQTVLLALEETESALAAYGYDLQMNVWQAA
jgi:outer membrane protein, multidrug efflux system